MGRKAAVRECAANIPQMTDPQGKPAADLLIWGANEVLTCDAQAGDLLGRRRNIAVAIAGEQILALDDLATLEAQFDLRSATRLDARGKVVAPGFVDCHTHVVFGGSRLQEYVARLTKTTAEVRALEIPTGIQTTVGMTRQASADQLYEAAAGRLMRMFAHGTTTVESKSGYGLSTETEIGQLSVNQRLASELPLDVVSTFLGAHDFPPEMSRQRYLELLINEMIPRVAEQGLAQFCDVYCDESYYNLDESYLILKTGLDYGLQPKIHLDAYADIGGARLAADLGVVSADHLNHTRPEAVEQLIHAQVTGVVMPALDFAVAHPQPFAGRAMLDQGLTLALATDICPACWVESMQFVIQLACRQYQFTPAEAIYGATAAAARAVGLSDRGVLAVGRLADLQIWDLPCAEEVAYRLGHNAVETVIKRGVPYHNQQGIQ